MFFACIENAKAVIALYKRILQKDTAFYIKDAITLTPYEFALKFEAIFGYDISALTYLVEKAAYRKEAVSEQDKQDAIAGYTQVKKVIKDYKRKKNSRFV